MAGDQLLNAMPAMSTLNPQPLTPEGFAPYGEVLTSAGRAGRPINAGSSLRVDLADPDLLADGGHPSLSVFRASAARLPCPARVLERHRLGTQTFVPLAGTPYIVVVALGGDAPRADTLAAFLADGTSGITLARGVWHHPLLALADGEFVVLERRGREVDCELAQVPGGPWTIAAGPG